MLTVCSNLFGTKFNLYLTKFSVSKVKYGICSTVARPKQGFLSGKAKIRALRKL
jgi:hypothetical protein